MKNRSQYVEEAKRWIRPAAMKLWNKKKAPPISIVFIPLRRSIIAQARLSNRGGIIQINLRRWRWTRVNERREIILHELAHIYSDYMADRFSLSHGPEWAKAVRIVGEIPQVHFSNPKRISFIYSKIPERPRKLADV